MQGDHKPVSLRVRIIAGAGDLNVPAYPSFHRDDDETVAAEDNRGGGVIGLPTGSMCPQYESPPVTDLLSPATSCTPSDKSGRIAYKDDKSVKVHKDTTA